MGEHEMGTSWPSAETNAVSDELDLDKWIDGTCGLTRTAKIFQRGDLITQIERLEEERAVAVKVEKELGAERGLNEGGSAEIQREIDALSREALGSALILHVQDRTEERREKIRRGLMKEMKLSDADNMSYEDRETINLHVIADAIVKAETADGKVRHLPDGFPPNSLREMRDRLGDSGLMPLWIAFNRVTGEAPQVSAPLSQRNSSGHGGIT